MDVEVRFGDVECVKARRKSHARPTTQMREQHAETRTPKHEEKRKPQRVLTDKGDDVARLGVDLLGVEDGAGVGGGVTADGDVDLRGLGGGSCELQDAFER